MVIGEIGDSDRSDRSHKKPETLSSGDVLRKVLGGARIVGQSASLTITLLEENREVFQTNELSQSLETHDDVNYRHLFLSHLHVLNTYRKVVLE